jgi:hypothetical protein
VVAAQNLEMVIESIATIIISGRIFFVNGSSMESSSVISSSYVVVICSKCT